LVAKKEVGGKTSMKKQVTKIFDERMQIFVHYQSEILFFWLFSMRLVVGPLRFARVRAAQFCHHLLPS